MTKRFIYKSVHINGKTIALHRHLMQLKLGRKLKRNEHVHHINHDRNDNRLENLEVMTATEHNHHHHKKWFGNCVVGGCPKAKYRSKYCNAHYLRKKIYGNPLEPFKRVWKYINFKCTVYNCMNSSYNDTIVKGLCNKHYINFRKYGHPTKSPRNHL